MFLPGVRDESGSTTAPYPEPRLETVQLVRSGESLRPHHDPGRRTAWEGVTLSSGRDGPGEGRVNRRGSPVGGGGGVPRENRCTPVVPSRPENNPHRHLLLKGRGNGSPPHCRPYERVPSLGSRTSVVWTSPGRGRTRVTGRGTGRRTPGVCSTNVTLGSESQMKTLGSDCRGGSSAVHGTHNPSPCNRVFVPSDLSVPPGALCFPETEVPDRVGVSRQTRVTDPSGKGPRRGGQCGPEYTTEEDLRGD